MDFHRYIHTCMPSPSGDRHPRPGWGSVCWSVILSRAPEGGLDGIMLLPVNTVGEQIFLALVLGPLVLLCFSTGQRRGRISGERPSRKSLWRYFCMWAKAVPNPQ